MKTLLLFAATFLLIGIQAKQQNYPEWAQQQSWNSPGTCGERDVVLRIPEPCAGPKGDRGECVSCPNCPPGRQGPPGRNGAKGDRGRDGQCRNCNSAKGQKGEMGPKPCFGNGPYCIRMIKGDKGSKGSRGCTPCANTCRHQSNRDSPMCSVCCSSYPPIAPPGQACRRCRNECYAYPDMPDCGNCCPQPPQPIYKPPRVPCRRCEGACGGDPYDPMIRPRQPQRINTKSGCQGCCNMMKRSKREVDEQVPTRQLTKAQIYSFNDEVEVLEAVDFVDIGTIGYSMNGDQVYIRTATGWKLIADLSDRPVFRLNDESESNENLLDEIEDMEEEFEEEEN